jgi:hypothetical protein
MTTLLKMNDQTALRQRFGQGIIIRPSKFSFSPEPVYSSGTQTLLLSESFETYANTQAVINTGKWNIRFDNQTTASADLSSSLRTSGGHTGNNFLRNAYSGVGGDAHDWNFVGFDGIAATAGHALYATFWERITFSSPIGLGTNLVWKHLMLVNSIGLPERAQFPCGYQSPYGTFLTGHSNMWSFMPSNNDLATPHCQQEFGPFPYNVQSTWFRVTFAYRTHTSSNVEDGFGRLWINGTLLVDCEQALVGVTNTGRVDPWCTQVDIDHIYVNNAIPQLTWGSDDVYGEAGPWTQDIDDLQIWRD